MEYPRSKGKISISILVVLVLSVLAAFAILAVWTKTLPIEEVTPPA